MGSPSGPAAIDPVATAAALAAVDFGTSPAGKAGDVARRMKQMRGWLDAFEAAYTNWVDALYQQG